MITFSCSEVKQIQACGLQKGKAGDRCRFEWAHRRGRCVGWHMKGPHQCLIIEGEQLVFTTVLLISVTYPNTFPVAMMVQWELTLSYSQGYSRVNFDMTPPWFLTFPVYHQVNVKKTMKNMYNIQIYVHTYTHTYLQLKKKYIHTGFLPRGLETSRPR